MKTVLFPLILLITIFSGSAWAQESSCITNDPTVQIIDTLKAVIVLPGSGELNKGQQGGSHIALEFLVTRTRDGQINYSIVPNSFHFEGDPAVIDAMGTRELFRMAEQAAIAQGVMAGYTQCGPDCKAVTVKVCQTACVRRIGTGLETRFEPCDPNACCTRTYQVCCPDGSGAPVTRLLSVEGAKCGATGGAGADCESICW